MKLINKNKRKLRRKNKILKEFSAGGVVYKKDNEGIKILLLKKTGQKITWVLPKGKIDIGESLEETALREVGEETGLKNLKIIKKIGQENYFYRSYQKNKNLIYKTVYYFLIETLNKKEKPNPQKEEGFIGYGWFLPEEAQKKATFPETKKIIHLAQKELLK